MFKTPNEDFNWSMTLIVGGLYRSSLDGKIFVCLNAPHEDIHQYLFDINTLDVTWYKYSGKYLT